MKAWSGIVAAAEQVLRDNAAAKQVAADLRVEAAMFEAGYYQARSEGRNDDARALNLSMWMAKQKAADIERRLRGIGSTGLKIGSCSPATAGSAWASRPRSAATIAWYSDIDQGACKILAHRYPDVPNLGDITTVDWSHGRARRRPHRRVTLPGLVATPASAPA